MAKKTRRSTAPPEPRTPEIAVVTPTLGRPDEVRDLLANLAEQTVRPIEVLIVDGAPEEDRRTEKVVATARMPFFCRHIRHGGGTAIQRNIGIACAPGDFVAFIDDDIRLEPDFFAQILGVFAEDPDEHVAAVTGYITDQYLDPATSPRWRWYRRLRLFKTYEPGRYDYASGYPINRYLQPPHDGVREVDFMGAGCAVWRRDVFAGGLRFDPFFAGYGVLEDAHMALRARWRWRLLECGRARCRHLKSQLSRDPTREVARKSAVNYRFVFIDVVRERSLAQELRFWRVQAVDLLRFFFQALRRPSRDAWGAVAGKVQGMWEAWRLELPPPGAREG